MADYFSPAKINLFLRVLSKRSDGFHELSTLMQTVTFGDTLTVEPAERDHFSCSDPSLPLDERNLVMKALRLFREKTGDSRPVSIHLQKELPHEAGLGGGSSNAATTLWALNELTDLKASEQDLMHWGAELGSDVPFFFSNGSALCTGRGERVESCPQPDLPPIALLTPPISLATPLVFAELLPTERSPEGDAEIGTNDLEGPAFRLSPKLKGIRDALLEVGVEKVALSGSGSTLICFGGEHATARPVLPLARAIGQWYCR